MIFFIGSLSSLCEGVVEALSREREGLEQPIASHKVIAPPIIHMRCFAEIICVIP